MRIFLVFSIILHWYMCWVRNLTLRCSLWHFVDGLSNSFKMRVVTTMSTVLRNRCFIFWCREWRRMMRTGNTRMRRITQKIVWRGNEGNMKMNQCLLPKHIGKNGFEVQMVYISRTMHRRSCEICNKALTMKMLLKNILSNQIQIRRTNLTKSIDEWSNKILWTNT